MRIDFHGKLYLADGFAMLSGIGQKISHFSMKVSIIAINFQGTLILL
jgi:hypothetical protein